MRSAFVDVARSGKNEVRLYGLGVVLIAAGYVLASVLIASVLFALGGEGEPATLPTVQAGDWGPALTLALLLSPSLWLLLAVIGVTRVLHRRPALSLVRADLRVRWRRLAMGAAVWVFFAALFELSALAVYPQSYRWSFVPARFFPLLLAGLVFVPLQSTAEELFFRGYLLQGLGSKLGGPWSALVLTSVLFGLVHGANPELSRFGRAFLLYYIAIGAVLGLATLLDDGLELAIGAHTANNLYGALVVSFPGSVLDTPSLVRMQDLPVAVMAGLGGLASVAWLLVSWRFSGWGWRARSSPPTPGQDAPQGPAAGDAREGAPRELR